MSTGDRQDADSRAVAALLFVQVLFGAMPVLGKLAIAGYGAGGLAMLRMGGAALFFQLLRPALRLPALPLREQPFVLLCAILGISANQLLFLHGLARTSATHAALLTTTIPVQTVVIAVLLGRERLDRRRGAGLLVALAGVLLLITSRDPTGHASLVGDLMIFANAGVYAAYLVLSRPLLARFPPLSVLPWLFTWGLLTGLPFAGLPAFDRATGTQALAAAGVVLGPTIGSYWLNLYALKRVPASVVAVFIYLQPPIAAFLAVPLLGERPGVVVLASAALTFAGVWLATRSSPSVTAGPPPSVRE